MIPQQQLAISSALWLSLVPRPSIARLARETAREWVTDDGSETHISFLTRPLHGDAQKRHQCDTAKHDLHSTGDTAAGCAVGWEEQIATVLLVALLRRSALSC